MIYFLSAQITQQSHAIVWNVFYLSKIATDMDTFLIFSGSFLGSGDHLHRTNTCDMLING